MKMRIYADGGSRGNPGPAASGAALYRVLPGGAIERIGEATKYLGHTTNNQAEYTAVVIGLQKARELGATEIELVMDSELVVRQLKGEYRVKHPELQERYREVLAALKPFASFTVRHVPRAQNKDADALVNRVLDACT